MQTERSIPELTKDVAFHLGDMFRNELKLARIEASEGIKSLSGAFIFVALGAAVGAAALTVALMAAAYGLSLLIPLWAAALVVTAGAGAVALLLVLAGKAALKPTQFSLPRTREQVSRDIKTISERVH